MYPGIPLNIIINTMANITLSNLVKNINLNVLAAVATSLVLALIAFLLYTFIPQELDLELIKTNFMIPISNFKAEQAERASYIISLLSVIPVFSLFYLLLGKKLNIKDDIKFLNKISNVPSLFCFILIILVCTVLIVYNKYWEFLFYIFGGLVLFFCKDIRIFSTKKLNISFFVLGIIFLARVLYLYLSKDVTDSYYEYVHFSVFSYPIFKVQNGLTLAVDFNNIYGYYAYIYLLLSKVLGAWNMEKVIYFNLILLTSCWLMIGFTINKFVKNKLLVLSAFCVFVYFTGGSGIFYLQCFPLRFISFSCIILLAYLFLFAKEKYKPILTFLGFAGACIGIVWNSETGLITLIAWSAFLIYNFALTYTVKSKILYKQIAKIILYAFLSFSFALIIYLFIPYLRTGKFITLEQIFWGATIFYKTGFFMLKITPYHPWFIPLIIYFIGLMIALNPILKFAKSRSKFLPFLFLITMIGFGFYSYYQGRSHFDVLKSASFPIFIIIVLFLDKLPTLIKIFSKNENLKPFCFSFKIWHTVLYVFLISLALFSWHKNFESNDIHLESSSSANTLGLSKNGLYNTYMNFMKKSVQDKNLIILTSGSTVFYQHLGIKDIYPFSPVDDLFLKSDYDKILTYIEKNNNSVIFTDFWLKNFEEYDMPRLKKILDKREKIVNYPITFYRMAS